MEMKEISILDAVVGVDKFFVAAKILHAAFDRKITSPSLRKVYY